MILLDGEGAAILIIYCVTVGVHTKTDGVENSQD